MLCRDLAFVCDGGQIQTAFILRSSSVNCAKRFFCASVNKIPFSRQPFSKISCGVTSFPPYLFKINQKHRDVGGADAGNPAGLPHGGRPDFGKLLGRLDAKAGNGAVIDIVGDLPALFFLELFHL